MAGIPIDRDAHIKNKRCVVAFALLALLLAGCQPKGWSFCEVISDCPQFHSTQLKYSSENSFSGIEVQLIKGNFGTIGYLNVCSRELVSGELFFEITGKVYPFSGVVLQGGQRLLLPANATQLLIKALLSNETVRIKLESFQTTLWPANFQRQFKKFQH
jgi:hypothetical protein